MLPGEVDLLPGEVDDELGEEELLGISGQVSNRDSPRVHGRVSTRGTLGGRVSRAETYAAVNPDDSTVANATEQQAHQAAHQHGHFNYASGPNARRLQQVQQQLRPSTSREEISAASNSNHSTTNSSTAQQAQQQHRIDIRSRMNSQQLKQVQQQQKNTASITQQLQQVQQQETNNKASFTQRATRFARSMWR